MKKIIIVILCLILFGCNNKSLINTDNSIIIDVRTKEEYNLGHIVNAINIPYDEINEDITLDKTKTIYVYCKSGTRSNIAYTKLSDLGYDVVDLGAFDKINMEKE
jgi:phage shock protein E